MIPVLLTRIKTRDGVTLDGIYVRPKRKSDTALIWIHGLGSNFYSQPRRLEVLVQHLKKNKIAFISFNTRGHDTIARLSKKSKSIPGGTGFENFKECTYDIAAVVTFLRKEGYKEIILAGHSTGANKALYYMYKKNDPRVRGLILSGPLSDTVIKQVELGKKFWLILKEIKKIARNKNLANIILQSVLFTKRKLPISVMTPNRYLSLYTPGSPEDVFPYGDRKARWRELRNIQVPLAVIIGSRDEHLDRSAKELIKIFQQNAVNAKLFSSIIIKGARHSFTKKEKELAKVIVDWIKKINRP